MYPIRPSPHFFNFIGLGPGLPDRLQGEFFWKFISKESLNLIREKKMKIIIDYSMENYIEKHEHDNLHESLKYSRIDKDSIYILVNSFNAKEYYENLFTIEERKYNVVNFPFCLDNSSWFYHDKIKHNLGVSMTTEYFLNSKNTIRKNYFVFKIKNVRKHRLMMFYKMLSNDLLETGDWSFLDNVNVENEKVHISSMMKSISGLNPEKIIKVLENTPYLLQSEQDNTYDKVSAWTDTDFLHYTNAYFDICSESFVNGEHHALTEKIFKPIANFQPFLFIAYPGSLQVLRDLGFKTFDGFIDESYDKIVNLETRIEKIYDEVYKLCSMSIEDLHKWYWSMEEILIYNQQHLLNFHKNKLYGVDVINDIINK